MLDAVEPVAGGRVDPVRIEQTDLVVVAQHARRHLAEPGELSDVQHDEDLDTPSHGVKVKRRTKEVEMLTQVLMLWTILRAQRGELRVRDERGSTVETVILTALLAGLAIGVAGIIIVKVTAKAHSIDLNH